MALPWLAVAFKAVPWSVLLKNAPQIAKAADALAAELKAKRTNRLAGGEDTLEARVTALEEHDRVDAEVMKQMAEQIEALTTTSAILARRLRLMTSILAAAVIVLVVVLLRSL